jgi:hypothetical protein
LPGIPRVVAPAATAAKANSAALELQRRIAATIAAG